MVFPAGCDHGHGFGGVESGGEEEAREGGGEQFYGIFGRVEGSSGHPPGWAGAEPRASAYHDFNLASMAAVISASAAERSTVSEGSRSSRYSSTRSFSKLPGAARGC